MLTLLLFTMVIVPPGTLCWHVLHVKYIRLHVTGCYRYQVTGFMLPNHLFKCIISGVICSWNTLLVNIRYNASVLLFIYSIHYHLPLLLVVYSYIVIYLYIPMTIYSMWYMWR